MAYTLLARGLLGKALKMNYLESLVKVGAIKEATASVLSEEGPCSHFLLWLGPGEGLLGWISNLPLKRLPMENVISGIRVKNLCVFFSPHV